MTDIHWRDYPQLFANGKFGASDNHGEVHITGYNGCLILDEVVEAEVDDCQLIARHIDDVTDDEPLEYEVRVIKRDIKHGTMTWWLMLKLLDRGIYPFPWPKDGSVIRREG